jgi:hypothetical protein
MNWLIKESDEDKELAAKWRANRGKDVPIIDEKEDNDERNISRWRKREDIK